MSRARVKRAGSVPTARETPVPPVAGWSLMEAVAALCPRALEIYRNGEKALQIALEDSLHCLSLAANRELALRPDAWLTLQILTALCERPDLQLTGRNYYNVMAGRARLPPDIIRAACERNRRGTTRQAYWVILDFQQDIGSIGIDVPANMINQTPPAPLRDMRIELLTSIIDPPTTTDDGRPVKPVFSRNACRGWFIIRVRSWPLDEKTPSCRACLEAARDHFSGNIPRDPFRKIRDASVPADWKKSGPRRAPKHRSGRANLFVAG